jgi:hypothetical protein
VQRDLLKRPLFRVEVPALCSLGAFLQVGDERFNSDEIHLLYDNGDYPLRKSKSGWVT